MQISKHISARMSQRGIRQGVVELTYELGEIDGDRYTLGRHAIDSEIQRLQRRLKLLNDARKKGAVTVVAADGVLITTYRSKRCSVTQETRKQ